VIHTYSLNGYNITIDGNSGSIHVLNDLTYQMLKDVQKAPLLEDIKLSLNGQYDRKEIEEAYNEIMYLTEQGMLFSTSHSLEEAAETKEITSSLKALCLHVSHDCNLNCEYCFASEGDYNSGRGLMSKDVAFKAVDYLIVNSVGRHNIEIDFFGGEPLMNFDVVKEVVAYGREIEKITDKKFYFTITTNGTLLNQSKIE
jgi:uncharacterized protein